MPADQGDSFGSGDMRVLPELPTPSCQTSIVNAGCSSAKPECAAGGDKMLISAPWGTTRQNMTLSAGEYSRRSGKTHSCCRDLVLFAVCRDGWRGVDVGAAAVTHRQELRCVSLDESLASPLITRARIPRGWQGGTRRWRSSAAARCCACGKGRARTRGRTASASSASPRSRSDVHECGGLRVLC